MTNEEIIKEIKKLADKHAKDVVFTGEINYNLAFSQIANHIKELSEENEKLNDELKQGRKCILDLWTFAEGIVEKAKKGDFSMFRINSIGGCDQYQGCPPICRIYDELTENNEEAIYVAIRSIREER